MRDIAPATAAAVERPVGDDDAPIDDFGPAAAGPDDRAAGRVAFFERVFAQWLADPDVTVACGRWDDGGAIAELVPQGRGHLLPARYAPPFDGIRELRLADSPHHLHVDFARTTRLQYVVAPSVCLAFRPSFEMRLATDDAGGDPQRRWLVSLMLTDPYRGYVLDEAAVGRFFARARAQAAERPDLVDLDVAPAVRASDQGAAVLALLRRAAAHTAAIDGRPTAAARVDESSPIGPSPAIEPSSTITPSSSIEPADPPEPDAWTRAIRALMPGGTRHRTPRPDDPACLPLFEQALALPDAALVLYRDRLLVEFQTMRLPRPQRQRHGGHVSWQVGDSRDHHCHLALGEVRRVLFSAEPVSCQGGGLNYTVWFLTDGASGNPWRADGYCSVVLNRPYDGRRPRREVIDPMFALYRAFADRPWVSADDTFRRAMEDGPPARADAAREAR